ncbi:hypothetical protein FRB90_007780 [Tulasnella sp. 427]|nr:hypothetical protein FRB90_007780 [Tulasnella sp. 427]
MNSASQATDGSGSIEGLHFGFQEETLLFGGLQLTSWSSFIVGILLTSTICLLERFITLLLSSKTLPARCKIDGHPLRVALLRTGLYAVATLLRLAYMLLSMTLHLGIILTIVVSLSIGQFCIEYRQACPSSSSGASGNRSGYYTPLPVYASSNDVESGSRQSFRHSNSGHDLWSTFFATLRSSQARAGTTGTSVLPDKLVLGERTSGFFDTPDLPNPSASDQRVFVAQVGGKFDGTSEGTWVG